MTFHLFSSVIGQLDMIKHCLHNFNIASHPLQKVCQVDEQFTKFDSSELLWFSGPVQPVLLKIHKTRSTVVLSYISVFFRFIISS